MGNGASKINPIDDCRDVDGGYAQAREKRGAERFLLQVSTRSRVDKVYTDIKLLESLRMF